MARDPIYAPDGRTWYDTALEEAEKRGLLETEVLKWQAEAGKFGPGMEAMEDLLQEEKAKNEKLRAALLQAPCPGGGFNGMPRGADPTIGLCIDHKVCGCVYGDALRTDR